MRKSLAGVLVASASLVGAMSFQAADAASGPSLNVEDLVPQLEAPQASSDHFSGDWAPRDLSSFDRATVRFIGSSSDTDTWVAIKRATGDICVISHVIDTQTAATACTTPVRFYHRGISVGVMDAQLSRPRGSANYLMPSNVDTDELLPSSDVLDELVSTETDNQPLGSENFLSVPLDAQLELKQLPRSSGGDDFTFSPLDMS